MIKKTVSLCMIVKNEAKVLERCLQSVKEKVNEIIVVDTGSIDDTVSIARKYEAHVYEYKWQNNFAEARNFAVSKATSDFILVLDADEFLDHDTTFEEVLSNNRDYYVVTIKNYMSNGYISYHQAIRLFKNHIGLSYYGKIHEHLNIEDNTDLTNEIANVLIHHDGYKQDVYKEKDKYNRNLQILLKEVKESPSGYNLFNLGVQYKVGGEYAKAVKAFKESYFLSKDKVYVPYLLYLLGDCLLSLDQYEEGINIMKDAIHLYPRYTPLYFMLGNLYLKSDYLLDAEFAYKQCLKLGEVKNIQSIEGVGSYLASIKLSEVLQQQGKLVESLEHAFNAVVNKKNFAPSISQYLNVLIQSGINKDYILNNIKQVYRVNNSEEMILLLGVLLAKRSSLLLDVIVENKLKVENQLYLMALIYANKYEEAFKCWEDFDSDEFNKDYLVDIINLAILVYDSKLLKEIISKLNLSVKERQLLEKFCTQEDFDGTKLSTDLSEIIIKILANFLRMNERNNFIKYTDKLRADKSLFFKLIKQANVHGFSDYVLENHDFQNSNLLVKHLELKGDVFLRNGKLVEALQIYSHLYNIEPNYNHLNKLYNFYEKTSDNEGMDLILKELSSFGISNIH